MAAMKVAVRVRPSDKESAVFCDPHVSTHIKTEMNPQGYGFSAVLGQDSTQREAYLECGLPMLEAALDGQRACLFAYGQTGSGKTFSLLGAEGGKNPHKLDGIVPQIVSECVHARSHHIVNAAAPAAHGVASPTFPLARAPLTQPSHTQALSAVCAARVPRRQVQHVGVVHRGSQRESARPRVQR